MSSNCLSALKFAIASCVCVSATTAFAAQITVTDCDGVPRLVKQVADNELQTLRLVTVSTGSTVGEFRLSLQDVAGVTKNATVKGSGTVTFSEVAPGTWKVCGLPADVVIDDVSLVGAGEGSSLQVASLVGAGGLVGGGLLLGSSNGGSGSADDVAAPLGAVVDTGSNQLAVDDSSAAVDTVSDRKRPFNHLEDCLISGAEGCLTGTNISSPISPFR